MKLIILAALLPLALATPLCERASGACSIAGTRGTIPTQVDQLAFRRVPRAGNVEACRALCHAPVNAACTAFGIREANSGGGACLLFNSTAPVSSSVRENTAVNTVYYVLPAGIVGGTPHNNPPWYEVDNTKTRGNYAGCRELCLIQANKCLGFAFKPEGNCRLFEFSLAGRVAEGTRSGVYDHNQVDCAFLDPPAKSGST